MCPRSSVPSDISRFFQLFIDPDLRPDAGVAGQIRLDLVIERDVLSMIRQRSELPRLLARLASQGAQPLNISKAAQASGLGSDTAERYVGLLESVFLIHRLPAWGRTLRSRVSTLSKVHLYDAGLAAHVLGLDSAKLKRLDVASLTEFGHLFETFCVNEVLKQVSWQDQKLLTGHWRTRDGDEVDLVLERRDGSVVAIEITAGSRVHGQRSQRFGTVAQAAR